MNPNTNISNIYVSLCNKLFNTCVFLHDLPLEQQLTREQQVSG